MAEAPFLLKGRVDEYQGKVDLLDKCLEQMESLKMEYQTHLDNLTDVMEETDDAFDMMKSQGEQNIESLKGSIKLTEDRKAAVQAAIDAMNEIGDNAKKVFTQGIETAQASVKAAIKVGQLLG